MPTSDPGIDLAGNTSTARQQRISSPASIHLSNEDVHVWWAALDPPERSLPRRIALLSADEKARAGRFYFKRDGLRYIAGRANLRMLLGAYLGLEPARIEFDYSPPGKPSLKSALADRVLQFNLSHSSDRAMYIFSWQRQVGIDIELVHPLPDEDDFARQFFSASESVLIHSLSGEQKTRTFFELWTCKEALLKAMGDGLTRPINEVEVILENGNAHLASIAGDRHQAARWKFTLFNPAIGYQAALAVEGYGGNMLFQPLEKFFQWK